MLSDRDAVPTDALEDIAYLGRSRNRVLILDALATEAHTRRELAERTGIARTTLNRLINEFEERGWAERTPDGAYETTPAGEFVITEFTPLVGAMQAIRSLGDAVAWLPNDELTIGLDQFSDATVIRPEPDNPMVPDTRLVDLIRETTDYHCLACIAPSIAFEKAMLNGLVDGRLTTEHVFTEQPLSYLADQPDRLSHWQDNLAAGAIVHRYDGQIPCNLFIMDQTVLIADRHPEACAYIKSENETVWAWAHEVFETYRAKAEPLTTETLTNEQFPSAKRTS
jgi:predicted transcriptional regulator